MVKNRIIMLGLDGATFEVINPLIENGELPTFKFLKENGAQGILLSTIPSITAPAWLALATGKNPGRTGVIDFRNLKENNSFKLYPISSEDFIINGAIWDYVSNSGGKVCIYNYPMLYPPYKVNGIMVSGLGAPEDLKQIVYPSELIPELKNLLKDNYRIIVPYTNRRYTHKRELFLKDLNNLLDQNIKIIKFLLKKEKWDLFIGIISATDFLQHYMWDVWESYKNKKKQDKITAGFIKIWKKIDDLIRFIIETNKDANVFIVSDHGFGELKYSFSINKWLENKGYLVGRRVKMNYVVSVNKLRCLFEKFSILTSIYSYLKEFLKKVDKSMLDFSEIIDFKRSKAFALDHSAFGHIYINYISRNYMAPIKTKDELLNLREQIVSELKDFVNSSQFLNEIEFFYPENIYKGPKLNLLPDILFNIDKMACEISPTNFDDIVKEYNNPNKTGAHRREGIFIAYGPLIKRGVNLRKIDLIDIVPTILYIMELPIPDDIDGKVLKEILDKNAFIKEKTLCKKNKPINIKNEIDEDRIKKQLKDLGYL